MPVMPVISTYRLQMRSDGMTFDDALALLPYLDELGVSHLYLSPVLTAASGSTHGYDVTDPTAVSAELGGPEGFSRLSAAARARGQKVVLAHGVFDILHAGHVSYLANARKLGDRLIVAVNSDASTKRLKGETRPVNPLE